MPTPGPRPAERAVVVGLDGTGSDGQALVDDGTRSAAELAQVAVAGAMVLVPMGSPLAAPGPPGSPPSVAAAAFERLGELLAAGAPAPSVAVEVELVPGALPWIRDLVDAGLGVAVRCCSTSGIATEAPHGHHQPTDARPDRRPATDRPGDADGTADAGGPGGADEAGRGRAVGLLTAALVAGASVVRTDDVVAARRVVAVVAALAAARPGAGGADAKMAP